jgi:hypothetical protein
MNRPALQQNTIVSCLLIHQNHLLPTQDSVMLNCAQCRGILISHASLGHGTTVPLLPQITLPYYRPVCRAVQDRSGVGALRWLPYNSFWVENSNLMRANQCLLQLKIAANLWVQEATNSTSRISTHLRHWCSLSHYLNLTSEVDLFKLIYLCFIQRRFTLVRLGLGL